MWLGLPKYTEPGLFSIISPTLLWLYYDYHYQRINQHLPVWWQTDTDLHSIKMAFFVCLSVQRYWPGHLPALISYSSGKSGALIHYPVCWYYLWCGEESVRLSVWCFVKVYHAARLAWRRWGVRDKIITNTPSTTLFTLFNLTSPHSLRFAHSPVSRGGTDGRTHRNLRSNYQAVTLYWTDWLTDWHTLSPVYVTHCPASQSACLQSWNIELSRIEQEGKMRLFQCATLR